MTPGDGGTAGLVCTGLVKEYGGVRVLKGVDITVTPSSVLGFIGENGAGKSTTSSIMTGVVRPEGGTMTLDGEQYAPSGPAEALAAGVALIHQEIRLLPQLSVAENIFLGRLPVTGARLDRRRMEGEAREALQALGVDLDPRRPVRGLPIAVQQEIEIAKAISRRPRYVVFDEPSASLGERETARVLEQIAVLRDAGAGVVYISHRLEEVRRIADEVVCLRDGERVASWATGDVPHRDLVNAMVGREFTYRHTAPQPAGDRPVLRVRGLSRRGAFDGIDFDVAAGEVLGLAGLVGAGRTEVVRAVAGVDRPDGGTVSVEDRPLRPGDARAAIAAGVVMVPEDRKGQGLNLDRTAAENITLPWEAQLVRRGLVTRRTVRATAERLGKDLDIRGRLGLPVGSMSGGNQQKVLLGKWLVRTPKVFIVDEPTRGVDVGAKMAIYRIIRDLAADGVAVVVVSSELEEVLGLAHRVLVMGGGRNRGVLTREQATPQAVMELAVLGTPSEGSTGGLTTAAPYQTTGAALSGAQPQEGRP